MERNDEEQIDFAEGVMDGADGRHHDACGISAPYPKHRDPEILMLVVTAGDDFIFARADYA